jgi:hypothetical protein
MVAADWLRSDRREDDLGGRPGSIVQVDFGVLVLNLIIFSHQVTTCIFFYIMKKNQFNEFY